MESHTPRRTAMTERGLPYSGAICTQRYLLLRMPAIGAWKAGAGVGWPAAATSAAAMGERELNR
jgi:hypothetical protein